jgi:hypothetical protein
VPPTSDQVVLNVSDFELQEDERGARWLQAKTRLGADSVTLIPLHRSAVGGVYLDAGQTTAAPASPVTRADQLRLLRRSIRVSHRGVVAWARSGMAQPAWGEAALLADCVPLVLTDGRVTLSVGKRAYRVILDHELGLLIEREGRLDDE